MKIEDVEDTLDEIMSVPSTTATAGASSTKLIRSSFADENDDSVKEKGAENTMDVSEIIPKEARADSPTNDVKGAENTTIVTTTH